MLGTRLAGQQRRHSFTGGTALKEHGSHSLRDRQLDTQLPGAIADRATAGHAFGHMPQCIQDV